MGLVVGAVKKALGPMTARRSNRWATVCAWPRSSTPTRCLGQPQAGFSERDQQPARLRGRAQQPTSAQIQAAAAAAGLQYVHQPVQPAVRNAAGHRRFAQLLAQLAPADPGVCRTGTRSGKL